MMKPFLHNLLDTFYPNILVIRSGNSIRSIGNLKILSVIKIQNTLPELLLMQLQLPVIQNHVILMRNVLNAAVWMDLICAVVLYYTMVIDPDSTDPLILLLPNKFNDKSNNINYQFV